MTRLPHENWSVKGVHDERYKVGPLCCVKGCGRTADHAHHLWRRSFLGADFAWVELWDGVVVQNLVGLCWRHHQEVTENRTEIRYLDDGYFYYLRGGADYGSLLDPQPLRAPLRQGASGPRESTEGSAERCPTCGKSKRRGLPPGPKRPKAQWAVHVPKDEREDGAEVLDTLLLSIAEKRGRADHASWRYFTLVEALAFAAQHVEAE